MKTRTILGFGAACLLASLASAAESIDPATLGNFDAIVALCRQLNPGGESAYKALRASLISGLSGTAVEALMQTEEYRDALEAGGKTAAKEPRESALRDCIKLVPTRGSRQAPAHKHE
jgi:hypothetical protein